MKNKALIIAAGAAVVGAGLLLLYVRRLEAEVSGGRKVPVVMATRDIPIGATLTEGMIGIRQIPEAYLEDRHIRGSDARRILGVRASLGVRANESILWTDLSSGGLERRSLSQLVQPGMRAMTIRADVTSSFGGLLRPGDRVDVLLTTTGTGGSLTQGVDRTTITLLQNVLVLAAGGDMGGPDAEPTSGKPAPVNQVTVSVTSQQAQLLSLARQAGGLTLVLRNPDDIAVADDMPETTRADIVDQERRESISRPHGARRASHREIEHVQ